jgi:RND family efflux transporter MFP subunit
VACAALVLAGCAGGGDAASGEPTAPPPVEVAATTVATVDSVLIQSGPVLSGMLTAERSAQLRPQVGGTIVALRVREGDRVRAGQSLAVIDTTVLGEQHRSALSGLRSAELSARTAMRDEGRSDTLFQAGAIAERDREAAHDRRLQAEAMLQDARTRVAAIEQQLEYAQVRAPFSGVISDVPASVGDAVQPGATPIAVLVDPTALELEASVPSENLGGIKPGVTVEFTVSAHPGTVYRGTVSRVNPAVDPATGQVRLYVRLPNAEGDLAVGLFAEGRVAIESVRGIAVPSDAIDRMAPEPVVKRVRGGVVESVPVTTGLHDELAERIQVTSGLAVGDTVLVGASLGTPVGAAVRFAPRDR